jgi:hypothetical protein
MKKKHLIALRGKSSVGKSSTLHLLYKHLLGHPRTKPIYFEAIGRKLDFLAIVSIEGYAVGIFNRGDVPAMVQKLLDRLVHKKCQVIVCASRTKGKIDKVLSSHGIEYELLQVQKKSSIGESQAISNNAASHKIAAMVYDALDGQQFIQSDR